MILKHVLEIIGKKNKQKFMNYMRGQTVGMIGNEFDYYDWDVQRFCRLNNIKFIEHKNDDHDDTYQCKICNVKLKIDICELCDYKEKVLREIDNLSGLSIVSTPESAKRYQEHNLAIQACQSRLKQRLNKK